MDDQTLFPVADILFQGLLLTHSISDIDARLAECFGDMSRSVPGSQGLLRGNDYTVFIEVRSWARQGLDLSLNSGPGQERFFSIA